MSLRTVELTALAQELSRELAGGVVQKVAAPTASRCFLDVRVPGRTVTLHVCADPELARLGVVDKRPPNPPNPPAWQAVLRRELTGAKLVGAEVLPGLRALATRWDVKDRTLTLLLEAGTPAVFLIGANRRILTASLPLPRGLRFGGEWTAPPAVDERPQGSRLASDHVHLRLLHGAEALFGDKEARQWREQQAAPLLRRKKQLLRTIDKVKADAARALDADRLRVEGELLAQNLSRVQRGAKSVSVSEWTEAGEQQRTIPLDPAKSPQENLARKFHQYRRLLRGAQLAGARIAQLEQELLALDAQLEAPANAEGSPAVGPRAARPADPPERRPYRVYPSRHGQPIWVGRGAASNDELTFHAAAPHHLWLHARGVPGAHVVIPLPKGQAAPTEVLLDAAHLAAHHSDAKGETKVEVSYVLAKHVRKAKGAGPGAVTYTHEKTLVLRVEPARLTRLLRAEGAAPDVR